MKRPLMIVGIMLAAAMVPIWAAETQPADVRTDPPGKIVKGTATNEVQTGLARQATAASGEKPAEKELSADEVAKILEPFKNSRKGNLPADFCVRITRRGYQGYALTDGRRATGPLETYEFTPTEVRLLQPRITGFDPDGWAVYEKDKIGAVTDRKVRRQSFAQIDDVCRILLALNYPELLKAHESARSGTNLNERMVMSGDGRVMPQPDDGRGRDLGGATIEIEFAHGKASCYEDCIVVSSFSSEQSIRFSALYHALRRLARVKLGFAESDWAGDLSVVPGEIEIKRGEPETPRKLAQDWALVNGKTDWGEITKIEGRGDHWLVVFTKILNQGTPIEHPAGVWIEKETGRTKELLGE